MPINLTEETVREVLGKSYNQFGFQGNTRLIHEFVYILGDPTMAVPVRDGEASPAAQSIRSALWSVFTGGGDVYFEMASRATSDLFRALGRENELGPLVRQRQ